MKPFSGKSFRTILIAFVLMSSVGCDQISKRIVRQSLALHEEVAVVGDIVTLTKVENRGAFLSLGESLPPAVRVLVLIALPLVMLTITILFVFTRKGLSLPAATGIGFVAGGGIGNVYDRIIYGSVTDFLHVDFGWFETGIFNLADVFIMTGALLVAIDFYLSRRHVEPSTDKADTSS